MIFMSMKRLVVSRIQGLVQSLQMLMGQHCLTSEPENIRPDHQSAGLVSTAPHLPSAFRQKSKIELPCMLLALFFNF